MFRHVNAPMGARLAAIALICLACGADHPTPSGEAADDESAVALVNGSVVTLAELDAWITRQLFEREIASKSSSAQYEIRAQALEGMINESLVGAEAAREGIEPSEVIARAQSELGPVSDEEVSEFYEKHRDRFPSDDSLELHAQQIRRFLENERRGQAVDALRSRSAVQILLQPPRAEIAASGPSRGPGEAPITIVEFSDFQCPFCSRAEPVVDEVLERYPERVRLVFRHFPLDTIHPRARAAAEASVCADAQGRFWEYHRQLFAHQRELGEEHLAKYAGEVGLDLEQFQACTQSPETQSKVQEDLDAGQAVGVSGTPAFFVNGILLSGAKPVEEFVKLIEQELAR